MGPARAGWLLRDPWC